MQTVSLKDIQKQVAVLEIAERFFDSVTLFALFESGVFTILASGPKTLQEIQERICGNEESLRATLDAAVALKLLTFQNGRYYTSELLLDCLGRTPTLALVESRSRIGWTFQRRDGCWIWGAVQGLILSPSLNETQRFMLLLWTYRSRLRKPGAWLLRAR